MNANAPPLFTGPAYCSQNSNTVPAAMWSIAHLIENRDLYRAVRDEVATAIVVDPSTGERTLDAPTLGAAPLLNALYTETLRYHVTFNIMREVSEETRMDGYDLRKGAWIQASTQIAHFDERLWARDGHPASEFWIGRFLEYEDGGKVPRFNGSMRPGSFFPYGMYTGNPYCSTLLPLRPDLSKSSNRC